MNSIKAACIAAYKRGEKVPVEALQLGPDSIRSCADAGGSFRTVYWITIGGRFGYYGDPLKVGIIYDRERLAVPTDGGDCAAGQWAECRKTGKMSFLV